MACMTQTNDDARLYIVDINSRRAHRLRVLDPVWNVAFDPSAQRLITVHSSIIRITIIMIIIMIIIIINHQSSPATTCI